MESPSPEGHEPILRREAILPRPQGAGTGVILLATISMMFAISSSLMLIHSHSVRRCANWHRPAQVHTAPAIRPCNEPQLQMRADGTQEIRYQVCTPAAPLRAR